MLEWKDYQCLEIRPPFLCELMDMDSRYSENRVPTNGNKVYPEMIIEQYGRLGGAGGKFNKWI